MTLEDLKREGWRAGINQVINAECLEGMALLPDKCIDAIICDLPYGTTACSWDTVIPFDKLWEQYKRIVKDNAPIVLFGSQPFTTDLINSNRDWFRYCLIYEKSRSTNYMLANKQPLKIHEDIAVFYLKQPTFNPQKSPGNPYKKIHRNGNPSDSPYPQDSRESGDLKENLGERMPTSVLYFNNPNNDNLHPTEKPLPLLQYLIQTYSNSGDLILDNCMGSWTTARACKDLSRNFIGFELEKKYCEIGEKRLQQQNLF